MKRLQHLTPILNIVFKGKLFFLSRVNGREIIWLKRCEEILPELLWDFSLDFPFKPQSISKVKDRKHRRACYQSFAQYKKSFKPKRLPRFRFIKAELVWAKHDDHINAISHLFCDDNFRKNFMLSWAHEPEQQVFKGLYPKQLIID